MTAGWLARSLGVVKRGVALVMVGALSVVLVAACGGQSSHRQVREASSRPEPPGITPQVVACQRAGKLICDPSGRAPNSRGAGPVPAGGHFLTGEQVLSRFGDLKHLRNGETVEAVRMTYRQLHAANPSLASATRLLVNPSRVMWAVTWHFSPPIPYQPCRYASCPARAPRRTIHISASSMLIDALTGQTTDSCTGCVAVPPSRGGSGTLRGELAVCCNAHGSSPEAGVIALRRIGGDPRTIGVNRTGHFSLALPIGRYQASGGIPEFGWRLGQCVPERPTSSAPPASPIEIKPTSTTRTSIVCQGQ